MPTATNPPTPAPVPATSISESFTRPPAALFDILPPLHALLSRLLPPSSSNNYNTTANTSSPRSPQLEPTLSPKDLITAAAAVTAKIQKAQTAVREIKGIGLSVEEQRAVIEELEEEVARGRKFEESLRRGCGDAVAEAKAEAEAEEEAEAEGREGEMEGVKREEGEGRG